MNTLHPPNNAIELPAFWTWMGQDGICRTKARPMADVLLPDAVANSLAVTSLYTGKKFPLIVDARDVKSISKDARRHFSIHNRDTKVIAFAIMVKSPLSRVIGNFFMGINKPSVPARLFDDEAQALAWLKTFI